MAFAETVGVLVAAILTFMVYTFLVKDNNFFKFAEHLSVGLAVGFSLTLGVKNVFVYCINPLLAGKIVLIIPLILGLFMYARYSEKTRFLSRWPLAIILGTGTGLAMRGAIKTQIIQQILATAPSPFITGFNIQTFNNLMIAAVVVSVMTYFLFTLEHKGVVGGIAKAGRYSLMIAFGAGYGGVVMSRQTMLFGRITFLVKTYPAYYVSVVVVILGIIYSVLNFTRARRDQ